MRSSILLLLFLSLYNTIYSSFAPISDCFNNICRSFSLNWDYYKYRWTLLSLAQETSKLPGEFDTVQFQALDGKQILLSKNHAESLAGYPPSYELYEYIRTHDTIPTFQSLENKWIMKSQDSTLPLHALLMQKK